jgi:hypothetical protein
MPENTYSIERIGECLRIVCGTCGKQCGMTADESGGHTVAEIACVFCGSSGRRRLILPYFLYSTAACTREIDGRACRGKTLIVQSRPGGFCTRGCLRCLRSGYLRMNDLPEVGCEKCGHGMAPRQDPQSSYLYKCGGCPNEWRLGDRVPAWSEFFEQDGLAAHGDTCFD